MSGGFRRELLCLNPATRKQKRSPDPKADVPRYTNHKSPRTKWLLNQVRMRDAAQYINIRFEWFRRVGSKLLRFGFGTD